MIKSPLKLAIKIKLFEKCKVVFTLLQVHSNIHKYEYSVFFTNIAEDFSFEKGNYTSYSQFRFIMPFKVFKNGRNDCNYQFRTEKDRYYGLNNLRQNLLEFSKTLIFSDINKVSGLDKFKILYYQDVWFLY